MDRCVLSMESGDDLTEAPHAVSRLWNRQFTLILLSCVLVYFSFHGLIATLPLKVKLAGGETWQAGLSFGILTLSAVLIRPFAGKAIDGGYKRPLFLGGLLLYAVPALFFPVVDSIFAIIALRFVQGLGWGVTNTAASTLAADASPPDRLGEAIGYFGMTSTLSMAVAPAASLWALEALGQPVLFRIFAGLALAALLVAAMVRIGRTEPRPGAAKPVFIELSVWNPALVTLIMCVTYASIVTLVPLYAQELKFSGAGTFFTAFALTIFATRPPAARLADRGRSRAVAAGGLALMLLTLGLLSLVSEPWQLTVAGIIYGAGFGAAQPILLADCLRSSPPERRGAATSTYWTAFDIGISIGSVGFGKLATVLGFQGMYLAGMLPALVALLLFLSHRAKRTGLSRA